MVQDIVFIVLSGSFCLYICFLVLFHGVELTFSWCCFQWFQKSGNITYNGHKLDEFCVRRTAAYISQTDNHIAELTVRETLDFAARCQGASLGFSGMSFPPFHSVNENFRP